MKYIENSAGGVHSVDDTFELPTDINGAVIPGWSFVDVEKVPNHVLGTEPDPVVAAVESHNGGSDIPDSPSTDAVGVPAKNGPGNIEGTIPVGGDPLEPAVAPDPPLTAVPEAPEDESGK